MSKYHDLIVGAFDNHTWEEIRPWADSIDKCGFVGKKAVILYNVKKDVADKLIERNFHLFVFSKDNDGNFTYHNENFSVVVERFIHIWHFLSVIPDIRYVITTDVKDVIFQSNPSLWLENNLWATKKKLVASGEGLRYCDEPWSRNNMLSSFGDVFYERLKNREIYCAGVIAGEYQTMIDLCLNIFLLCRGGPLHVSGGGGPDQAAYNILLSLEPYKSITKFDDLSWACQAGTTKAAIEAGNGEIGFQYKNGNLKLEDLKFLKGEPFVFNGKLHPESDYIGSRKGSASYCIVHQYNRVPEWKLNANIY